MPAHKSKNPDGTYRVETPNQVHAESTTKKKAEAQVRLLNAIDHGFTPTGKHSKMDHKHFEGHDGYKKH